jgi:hypothetical protein
MKISVRDNRQLYKKAKQQFSSGKLRSAWRTNQHFLDEFGIANNMKVIIDRWEGPFPVVTQLEFNTEADYVWFMLRYS